MLDRHRINWKPTAPRGKDVPYNFGQIRVGDDAAIPEKLHQRLAGLARASADVRALFDLLVLSLSPIFDRWKGTATPDFRFGGSGRPANAPDCVIGIKTEEGPHLLIELHRTFVDNKCPHGFNSCSGKPDWFCRSVKDEGEAASLIALVSSLVWAHAHSTGGGHQELVYRRVYVRADETISVDTPLNAILDPSAVERGTRAHVVCQNALGTALETRGVAFCDRPRTVNFDLAWLAGGTLYVAEIKSTTQANEVDRLRTGLGQVLGYRYLLSKLAPGTQVRGVLMIENCPQTTEWIDICASVGVILLWRENFEANLQPDGSIRE